MSIYIYIEPSLGTINKLYIHTHVIQTHTHIYISLASLQRNKASLTTRNPQLGLEVIFPAMFHVRMMQDVCEKKILPRFVHLIQTWTAHAQSCNLDCINIYKTC